MDSLCGIPAGVPVLALSAMGQFQGAAGTTAAWLALGQRRRPASGLPAWFAAMVERLTPAMRAEGGICELIAQGLALAHAFAETPHAIVPAGVDETAFKAETRAAAGQLAQPVDYCLELLGGEDSTGWQLSPAGFVRPPQIVPLAMLRVGGRPLHLTFAAPGGQRHRFQAAGHAGAGCLAGVVRPRSFHHRVRSPASPLRARSPSSLGTTDVARFPWPRR
jgi:hypothetical protein